MALKDLIRELSLTPVELYKSVETYANLHRVGPETVEALILLVRSKIAEPDTIMLEISDLRLRTLKLEQEVARLVNLSNGIENA